MDAHREKLQSREEDRKKMTQLRKARHKIRGTGATLEEKELDQVPSSNLRQIAVVKLVVLFQTIETLKKSLDEQSKDIQREKNEIERFEKMHGSVTPKEVYSSYRLVRPSAFQNIKILFS